MIVDVDRIKHIDYKNLHRTTVNNVGPSDGIITTGQHGFVGKATEESSPKAPGHDLRRNYANGTREHPYEFEANSVVISGFNSGLEVIVYDKKQIHLVEGYAVWEFRDAQRDPAARGYNGRADMYIQEGEFVNMVA